jgi:tetratricopeptide (TPR) repeat protein
MSQISFSPDWLRQFSEDPYAVLGVALSADDRRVLKRYRMIAKLLHPDSFAASDTDTKTLATQMFARLVSPAYNQLKQENGRNEVTASLRYHVRRMSQIKPFNPTTNLAQQLSRTPAQSVDIIYEEAIVKLAEFQYQKLDQFASLTQQMSELNLTYLCLKMGEPILREKRTGIVPIDKAKPPIEVPLATPKEEEKVDTGKYYAQRHYQRAQEYMKKSNWALAVQELRDAIRIDANTSDYHALLAKAYLMQNLPGMATVHFRQALKLNPKDPLAVEYAQKLKINLDNPRSGNKNEKTGGLFGGLFAKKR